MTKTEAKFERVKVAYLVSEVKEISAKHAFDFEFDGSEFRCGYDENGHLVVTFSEDVASQLVTLVKRMERLIGYINASTADVSKFLIKYLQMNVMIDEELQKRTRT
jgi:hypothetical protein